MGYTFEIEYKLKKENVAVDDLSRVSGSHLLSPHNFSNSPWVLQGT